ncbi:hypothetical protein BC939DRAFT_4084 [Gamsiella multidivaricata]|uniref:uncharacterized protein n=1 Tax=Gamsiella multidivaricata TaxID=101098 RepID=UPI00221F1C72|nr:uncharacterized protein BC939DRAFT_4084 [Gamsiella multidivaricata]KAG0365177.1 hypothetical protein BGZ54_006791 [Gamsiella multidivaricata]KAI7832702.1 hypothetical protein BC939DRAFT_4084 [Gamsiella multidivaricata]
MSTHNSIESNPAASPRLHVLELCDIILLIGSYLDAKDMLAFSAVSRSIHYSLGPLVWQDLHFGLTQKLDDRDKPFARSIPTSLTYKALPVKDHYQDSDDPSPNRDNQDHQHQNELLSTLSRIAPLVQSLSIHKHDSGLPLQFGAICHRLESITLAGLSLKDEKSGAIYWENCRKMLSQNQPHLQSLALVD